MPAVASAAAECTVHCSSYCQAGSPPYNTSVSRFWLTYCKPSRRQLFGVVILDSGARIRATVYGLDRQNVALVPATASDRHRPHALPG
jgi:hypothetical protein